VPPLELRLRGHAACDNSKAAQLCSPSLLTTLRNLLAGSILFLNIHLSFISNLRILDTTWFLAWSALRFTMFIARSEYGTFSHSSCKFFKELTIDTCGRSRYKVSNLTAKSLLYIVNPSLTISRQYLLTRRSPVPSRILSRSDQAWVYGHRGSHRWWSRPGCREACYVYPSRNLLCRKDC
jgi:hypothetical protein